MRVFACLLPDLDIAAVERLITGVVGDARDEDSVLVARSRLTHVDELDPVLVRT